MDFCHIAPTNYLNEFVRPQRAHLLLAHLIEEEKQIEDPYKRPYTFFYKHYKYGHTHGHAKTTYILDNSAFEMYKQGKPMFDGKLLADMGRDIDANYVVMSDYPNEPGMKTIESALHLAPQFKDRRLGTFFVPQSKIGDLEDYIATFAWAASSPLVDYIGISILGVPNAFGVEKNNKMQRFLARWKMMNILRDRGLLALASQQGKKIHFLGMVDGPNEISLMQGFQIDTWDSSAAVWAGLNDVAFDKSPTGLIHGKFEKEVDFGAKDFTDAQLSLAHSNIKYIDTLARSL